MTPSTSSGTAESRTGFRANRATHPDMCASRFVAMILWKKLHTSSYRHTGRYKGWSSSFRSNTSLAVRHIRGLAPSFRHDVNRSRSLGAMTRIISPHSRHGTPSGPGATSREAIILASSITSPCAYTPTQRHTSFCDGVNDIEICNQT